MNNSYNEIIEGLSQTGEGEEPDISHLLQGITNLVEHPVSLPTSGFFDFICYTCFYINSEIIIQHVIDFGSAYIFRIQYF